MKKRLNLLLLICTLCLRQVYAQQSDTLQHNHIRTAANVKTGNSQDILPSFFQMALDDLSSNDRTFRFQSSIIAIQAKTNPGVLIDTNYLKKSFARNFAFNVGVGVDQSFKFRSNSVGFKYAIVNQRDKSIFDFRITSEKEWNAIKKSAMNEIYKKLGIDKYKVAADFFNRDTTKVTEKDLDPEARQILLDEIKKDKTFKDYTLSEFRNYRKIQYDKMAAMVENKPLWIIGATGLSDTSKKVFSSANIHTEFLKGITNPEKPVGLEIDLKGDMNFNNDSNRATKNTHRQVISFAAGLNVFVKNKNHTSIMELKLSATGNYFLSGMYTGETKNFFTLDGTLRFKITDKLWIPMTLKYDPKTANLFGFLNITSNFDALGKLLKN